MAQRILNVFFTIYRAYLVFVQCVRICKINVKLTTLMSRISAKNSLRKIIQAKLKALDKDAIQLQSESIFKTLIKDARFQKARSVGLYMSMPLVEVDTSKLIEYCFKSDKEVYLPKCVHQVDQLRRSRHMNMLKVLGMDAVKNLKHTGKYNLREPETGESIMDKGGLDVLILPGLAFTMSGERLGHGAGYYDEFLQAYETKFGELPYLVGVSLQEQIVDHIPMENHDRILDTIVVGNVSN